MWQKRGAYALFLPSFSLFFMVHLVVKHFSFATAAAPSVSAILSGIGGCFPSGGKNSAPHPCLFLITMDPSSWTHREFLVSTELRLLILSLCKEGRISKSSPELVIGEGSRQLKSRCAWIDRDTVSHARRVWGCFSAMANGRVIIREESHWVPLQWWNGDKSGPLVNNSKRRAFSYRDLKITDRIWWFLKLNYILINT